MEFINRLKKKFEKTDYKALYEKEKVRADATEARFEFIVESLREITKKADNEGAIEWAKSNNLF